MNDPKDIMLESQVAEAIAAKFVPVCAVLVTRGQPIAKLVADYKAADWSLVLKENEFSEDGKRYVILKVEYKRSDVNNYIVDFVEGRFYKNGSTSVKEADRPLYVLYAALSHQKGKREMVYSGL